MNVKDIKTIGMYGAGTIGGGFCRILCPEGAERERVRAFREASKGARSPTSRGPTTPYVKLGLLDGGQKIWGEDQITTDPAEAFTGVYFVQENGAENPGAESMRWWP